MSEDQITALAREYAEEMIKGRPSEELPNCLKNSMLAMNTEYIAEIFQWLTRRFYLVEKEAVRKEYDLAEKLWIKSACATTEEFNMGRMNAIQSLFPEIAKEVGG